MFNKEDKKVADELSNSSNIIGKGTSLEGDIESYGNIRVEGKVTGSIKTKSKVALGQSSALRVKERHEHPSDRPHDRGHLQNRMVHDAPYPRGHEAYQSRSTWLELSMS